MLSLLLALLSPRAATSQNVSFNQASSGWDESVGLIGLKVFIDTPSTAACSVMVTFQDITAQRGETDDTCVDYIAWNTNLLFQPAQTSRFIAVEVVDDDIYEAPESFRIVLSDLTNLTFGVVTQHVFNIFDNEYDNDGDKKTNEVPVATNSHQTVVATNDPRAVVSPTIRLQNSSMQGEEGRTNVDVKVVLSAPATQPVSFFIELGTGSTATVSQDFTMPSAPVVIPPGSVSHKIRIHVEDDGTDENEEGIRYRLTAVTNATIGSPSNGVYTIVDDDELSADITSPDITVSESSTSTTKVIVVLSGPSERTNTVRYALDGIATPGTDYTPTIPGNPPVTNSGAYTEPLVPASGLITFIPGVMAVTSEFRVISDNVRELDEDAIFRLVDGQSLRAGSNAQFVMTIQDDDGFVPTVQFADEAFYDDEGFSSSAELVLDQASTTSMVVTLAISGNATGSNVDYSVESVVITIPAGATNALVPIEVVDDSLVEADENVVLTITNVVRGIAGDNNVFTRWIVDNDRNLPSGLVLFRQDIPSAESNRFLTLVGPKTSTFEPRGIAVDNHRAMYITDEGATGGPGDGTIWYLPPGSTKPIRLVSGLTRPGDIELSPDQRAIIVALPGGVIRRYGLGLTVRFQDINPFVGNTHVTAVGERGSILLDGPDPETGYFHAMDVIEPGSIEQLVDVIVEYRGRTRVFADVPLGRYPGSNATVGHTFISLRFEEEDEP